MTLHRRLERLERLERPLSQHPGEALFIGMAGREADIWRGRNREWTRRPGETAEDFKARVEREALPAGNLLLVAGFNFEPQPAA